ncbi:hypothetical protein ACSBR2_020020 [Camellia fascicularis]
MQAENTDAPDIFKHNCLMSIGKKWKDWTDQVKRKHFNKYKTNEERLANCPDMMDPSQWEILVQFWNKHSITNGDNRKKQTMCHTSGRKAHCRVRHEIYKNDGVQLDQIKVYIETHRKKNGTPVDDASDIAIARVFGTSYSRPRQRVDMDKLRSEVQEELQQELLAEFDDKFTWLERKCDKMQAHVETMGYPMPQSPSMPK